ncbi:hypothetical protein GKD57_23650 [Parabacteroides distasonis]|nr:hypothetical protein [Parabacteroides distasonis]
MAMGYGDVRCKHLTGSIVKADIKLFGDIPKIIKFKATNSLRVSCLFCIFKHSPQKTV